jgi:hypothetical protein
VTAALAPTDWKPASQMPGPVVRGGDPIVQRGGDTKFEDAVYGGVITGLRDVPAQLQGRALKIYVVARWGKLSTEQATVLVDRTGMPSGGIARRVDGSVVFGLTPAEETMILRLRPADSPDTPRSGAEPVAEADPERTVAEKVAIGAADVGTDLAPIVSNVKDATIALTGVNPVTGERVGVAGRVASAIFAIPIIGNLAKYLGKGSRWLWKGVTLLADKIGVKRFTSWAKGRFKGLTGKARAALKGVDVTIDSRKFSDDIFKEGATHGKDKVFRSLGYGREHSEMLVEHRKQASERYASGVYELGKKDQYGQRIDIEIVLEGIGPAAGKSSSLRSGWMIRPDGSVSLNTPFSGFMR